MANTKAQRNHREDGKCKSPRSKKLYGTQRKKKRGEKEKGIERFESRRRVEEDVVGRRQIMQKLEYFLGTGLWCCVACVLAGRVAVPSY